MILRSTVGRDDPARRYYLRVQETIMKNTLSNHLSPSRLERIICLEETESTNTYLKNLAADAPDGLAVLSRRQSGGRGRVGRSFSSPEGGLYLSLLYSFDAPPAAFTACAAVAVRRAIKASCGLEAGIKWVNDLLLDGKKVCGILTESADGAVVVGIGLNVNTADFPPELPGAASLASVSGREYDIAELAAAVIRELDGLAAAYPACLAACRAEYAAACVNPGREVLIIRGGEKSPAFAEAVAEDFSLLVRYPDGKRENVFYGEVSLRGADGEYV